LLIMLDFLSPSFRDAPLGAGPESITTILSMDSGLALRAPSNAQLRIGE
jgi:error-prone DNA polymerase